jgi:hypothetical protein
VSQQQQSADLNQMLTGADMLRVTLHWNVPECDVSTLYDTSRGLYLGHTVKLIHSFIHSYQPCCRPPTKQQRTNMTGSWTYKHRQGPSCKGVLPLEPMRRESEAAAAFHVVHRKRLEHV